jgi:hypothetical protein
MHHKELTDRLDYLLSSLDMHLRMGKEPAAVALSYLNEPDS